MGKNERMYQQIEKEAVFRPLTEQEKTAIADPSLWSGEICDLLDLDKPFNRDKIRMIRAKYGIIE